MDDAAVEAELERLEREELEEERRWELFVDAIEAGAVGPGYAGRWTDDDDVYVAATAGDVKAAQEALSRACPDVPLRVVPVAHSLLDLERLRERVISRADDTDAGIRCGSILEHDNHVEIMLVDLAAPSALGLQAEFTDEPIVWIEGDVEAV
jgi:hypothetical protein